MRTISETSRTVLNAPTFESEEYQKKKTKRNPESSKQDKPKAKHSKTHINQINEDQIQRANIKSSKEKATNNTQGDPHKDNN